MSYDECIRTVPAKKMGHTVLKKPNKAVFKVDK